MPLRYWALQAPGIGLFGIAAWAVRGWLGWPDWIAYTAVSAWIALDVVMYPLVKHAYEPHSGGGAAAMVGAAGTAQERLDPAGYVRVAHELWRAELPADHAPVEAGGCVRVRRVDGLTLMVVAEGGEEERGVG